MRNRNSMKGEHPATILRRSTRFLHNQTQAQYPKTLSPITQVSSLDPPPSISTRKVSRKTAQNNEAKIRNVLSGSNHSEGSGISNNGSAGVEGLSGLRRSLRLSRIEKISVVESKKAGNNSQNGDKHAKKSGGDKCDRLVVGSKAEILDKGAALIVDKKAKLSMIDSSEQVTMGAHSSRASSEIGEVKKEEKHIGIKRKRNEVEKGGGDDGIVGGWTKDQELALQRAYFAAKPTPHFWKKVSRMVPGKSAHDCFNKIHADHTTPPQPKPRSRAKTANSSSLPLSPTKLLDFMEPKSKKPTNTKQKSHNVQKTMRHLLQKQYQVDQDQNADLFSVFEPTLSLSTKDFWQSGKYLTPDRNQKKTGILKRCQERSSSAHKEQFSRFNSSSGATVVSPLVLKPVKNKALHEKYIDRLHNREAKRNAAAAKAAKSNHKNADEKENHAQNINAIEAAKNALILDARDAISQFQRMQANVTSSFSDADENAFDSDEDEGEDKL